MNVNVNVDRHKSSLTIIIAKNMKLKILCILLLTDKILGRLKGVPTILSPDLLHAIASMGHGDEIVLADANFPAASTASEGAILIDASGHGIPDLLEAILQFFPLDTFVLNPVVLMDLVNSDKKKDMKVPIWDKYQKICNIAEERHICMYKMERFKFYQQAKSAYAIVATGESALYANIILMKGIVVDKAKEKNEDFRFKEIFYDLPSF